jgi:DNA-binding HxlR family transcriptional regulator
MRRTSFEGMPCSIAQCLEAIGEWWTVLILRDAFLGVTRFDAFQRRLGIARNVLTQRLTHLMDHGILERVAYQDNPVRYDYRLTDKGRDLWPVLTMMRQWGDQWAAPAGPPREAVHLTCGHVSLAVPVCDKCGETLELADIKTVSGPGAGASGASA